MSRSFIVGASSLRLKKYGDLIGGMSIAQNSASSSSARQKMRQQERETESDRERQREGQAGPGAAGELCAQAASTAAAVERQVSGR